MAVASLAGLSRHQHGADISAPWTLLGGGAVREVQNGRRQLLSQHAYKALAETVKAPPTKSSPGHPANPQQRLPFPAPRPDTSPPVARSAPTQVTQLPLAKAACPVLPAHNATLGAPCWILLAPTHNRLLQHHRVQRVRCHSVMPHFLGQYFTSSAASRATASAHHGCFCEQGCPKCTAATCRMGIPLSRLPPPQAEPHHYRPLYMEGNIRWRQLSSQ